ncbi:MAG: hypothetical protein HYT37_03945 [Candidatus Sungbacteria bacterium]|nr:hypothetical protein [Candidatus Sungbacteria bacterium]
MPFIHSAYAAVENTTVDSLVNAIIVGLLSPAIKFLFVLATVIFLYGVITYVVGSQGSDAKLDKGKKVMQWGIVGMFIMASAWGIVKVLCDFFGSCSQIGF